MKNAKLQLYFSILIIFTPMNIKQYLNLSKDNKHENPKDL